MRVVLSVYVRKGRENVHYTCSEETGGFLCGRCGDGILGMAPKYGKKCKVCGAKVSQVIADNDVVATPIERSHDG
jgi:hypothetical protein